MKISRKKLIEDMQLNLQNNNKLSLYIDTPFCPTICKYCMFSPVQLKDKKIFEAYKKHVISILKESYSLLENSDVEEIYFGGGSAGLLDINFLKEIKSIIPKFKEIKHKAIEYHPNLLTDEKIDFLIENKFSFVSIGIQTLNNEFLKQNNRPVYNVEKLKKHILKLQKNNIIVSLDLIGYINCNNKRRFPDSIYSSQDAERDLKQLEQDFKELANNYKPDRITIYPNVYSFNPNNDISVISKKAYRFYLLMNSFKKYGYSAERINKKFLSYNEYFQKIKEKPTFATANYHFSKGDCYYFPYSCENPYVNNNIKNMIYSIGGARKNSESCFGYVKKGYYYCIYLNYDKQNEKFIEWIEMDSCFPPQKNIFEKEVLDFINL